ncbi:MAG: hypothetical protein NVSMB1_23180 [Polyangiales bacterium]
MALGALLTGLLLPRACGLKFTDDEASSTNAAGSVESSAAPSPPTGTPAGTTTATPTATPTAMPNASQGSSSANPSEPKIEGNGPLVINVGKSSLMQCQDPPATELKPSKCGDPMLDAAIAPKLEQLSACPGSEGLSGRLQIGVDVNFQAHSLRIIAGKSSMLARVGRRDEHAIEPILNCLRASLKDFMQSADATLPRDHARYLLFFPVTLATSPVAPAMASASMGAQATLTTERSMSGSAKVEVDAAIVRDAPNINGQLKGRLSRGTVVSTVGLSGNWYHIKFGEADSQDGWMFRNNIGR